MDISGDCLFHLFGYLDYPDIIGLFRVNKELYKISVDDMTWRRILQTKYPSIESLPGVDKYKSWRQYTEVIHTGARLYHVDAAYGFVLPKRDLPPGFNIPPECLIDLDEFHSQLVKEIKYISKNIRRGDVVRFGKARWMMIWDGCKLEPLLNNNLPPTYTLEEFIYPYRWHDARNGECIFLSHTSIWVDFTKPPFKIIKDNYGYSITRDSIVYSLVSRSSHKARFENLLTRTPYQGNLDYRSRITDRMTAALKGYVLTVN